MPGQGTPGQSRRGKQARDFSVKIIKITFWLRAPVASSAFGIIHRDEQRSADFGDPEIWSKNNKNSNSTRISSCMAQQEPKIHFAGRETGSKLVWRPVFWRLELEFRRNSPL